MTDLSPLIQLGPSGLILIALILGARTLLPLLTQAVGHLSRMADATQKLTLQLEAQGRIIEEIRGQVAEVAEDQAGLYALAAKDRPSRRRKPAAAIGD